MRSGAQLILTRRPPKPADPKPEAWSVEVKSRTRIAISRESGH
jgi:hypothetical protein